MHSCTHFDLTPDQENPECCQLCHDGEEGHHLVVAKDYKGEPISEVCHPLADRLRAMGYLLEEA